MDRPSPPSYRKLRHQAGLWIAAGFALTAVWACRGRLEVPKATASEATAAFHVGLAALQTGQEVLAREKLTRVTELVPAEPAGWANLGLLLLRQQETEEAAQKLAKAAELAPASAALQRLLALAESRRGRLPEAIAHLRRAVELDPGDLKAAFALAQEIERQGGAENEAEAQRAFESLLKGSPNLAARLEHARVAAKRGDAAALQQDLVALAVSASAWPPEVQDQWKALQETAASNPKAAAARVAFLKNVLLRVSEYRRALAAVSTPRDEVGEPIFRFLVLENPGPQPAPPDLTLAFAVAPVAAFAEANANAASAWVGPVWLTGEGSPALVVAGPRGLRMSLEAAAGQSSAVAAYPAGSAASPPRLDGVAAADLNYDFRTDLVLAGAGGIVLLRQRETGLFQDVTAETKLSAATRHAPAYGVWAADVDTEGDLDLVLAPVQGPPLVLRNNGDGTFAERRLFPGVSGVRGFAWADLDGEGVPDAAFLQEDGRVRVFLSLRGGDFREAALPAGRPKAVALAVADANADGVLDLLLLDREGSVGALSRAADGASFQWTEAARVDPPVPALEVGTARLLVADLDNNGAADLVESGPAGSQVLLSVAPGEWKARGGALAFRARATADLEGDGWLDLLGLDAEGRVARATGQGSRTYHWQSLRPRAATAQGDQRINSFGIGGEVEIRAGLHAQKQAITAPVVHFGLGEAARADVVRIVWPNGVLQSEFDQAGDATVLAEQRLKGSCPWLFAWNGREMAFVTDLIWRSPLGLRVNAQATAEVVMTEDRVKLRGDQLAAREGAYDLRITAELWETHFFDLVGLQTVDHEEGTEVFVDERFAVPPPSLAPVVTGPVGELRAARDDQGRDVAAVVRARDGRHLDFAGRGAYQGVTRDHFVELELPEEAPRQGPLYLVAQGWVHPTDSSVNVALGQGSLAAPRGLSLSVADATGRFREIRKGLGFPAGKDKTLLLDLAGVFEASGPRRLRLGTNLEVFWDRLGWAEGRRKAALRLQDAPLLTAELRYRGYSVTGQEDASSPERPRYLLAGTAPRWRDLEGYHTRFGDVRELVGKVDDRYVIMNAGDELRLRFAALPPPPPGRRRDFVMIGDGWVKDGDFNTTFSRTVLPLPTHASGRYDTPPGRLEDDPVYRAHPRDFAEYHTRYVTPEGVRDALLAPSPRKPGNP